MAAGLAHELNNPLGALQLTIDSAMDTIQYSPETAESLLGTASGAIARARTLNENFLRFTGEAQTRAKGPLSLKDTAMETLEALEHSLSEVEVVQHFDQPCMVLGDRHELEMVITNLILNAKDAVAECEKPKLSIHLAQLDSTAVLSIDDSGHGVDAKNMDRIFEPFFTTKPLGSGWGLGLSVSREIVESHEGTLVVTRSKNYSGTLAQVTLPLLEQSE